MGKHTPHHQGFTLIELLVVLVVIGTLTGMALGRYDAIADTAHRAGVRGTGAAYHSGVVLVHAQWLANGSRGATLDVANFGAGNVDVSVQGWPVDSAGATSTAMTAARCLRLWQALLQTNAPTVTLAGDGHGDDHADDQADNPADDQADYRVTAPSGGHCRYEYKKDNAGRRIDYNVFTGEVLTTSP